MVWGPSGGLSIATYKGVDEDGSVRYLTPDLGEKRELYSHAARHLNRIMSTTPSMYMHVCVCVPDRHSYHHGRLMASYSTVYRAHLQISKQSEPPELRRYGARQVV